MSAITGIIGPRLLHGDSASDLALMVRALRGGSSSCNDTTGSFRPQSVRAHVAWVRREYERVFAGWNDRRDIHLVFTGEEFDAKVSTAFSSTPQADAESSAKALIHLYETHGTAFINDLNGRFCGVVCDLRTGITHLFNDRYGLNRVYTHAAPDGFFFSSEAKALLAVLPGLRKIDPQGRAEFLALGCVLQNRSLFAGISLLPPGSCWSFQPDGSIRKRRYFDPSVLENQEPLTAPEFGDRLADLFGRISPKYMLGPGRVGMSLTGGLDSRMILAWARVSPGSLPCYTFGGPYRDCADVRIAQRLAVVTQQPHTTLRISSDFFERFASLAEQTVLATDGAMDVSGAVELYVNQLARQIAPIRITGNYGSEILRSNIAFRPRKIDLRLFTPEFRPFLEEAAATYHREAAGHRLSFIAFKQVPWHHYARFAAERSQLTPRSPFLDNELVALAYRAPQALEGSAGPILTAITKGNSALDAVDTDRALIRGSIPLLDPFRHRWQEFTAKAEYAYDYGMPRWLARTDSALRRLHLERLFLGRHKFYHFRVWYRDQLAPALNEQINHHDQPSCYVEGMAKKLVQEHTSGRANRTLELHQLLSVQLIDRLLIGKSCRN